MKKDAQDVYIVSLNMENAAEMSDYERFVSSHPRGSFFQSLRWLKLKSNWTHEVYVVKDTSGRIQGCALILIKRLPVLGQSMIYVPRGPVCDYQNPAVFSLLLDAVMALKQKYRGALLRLDPCIENTEVLEIQAFLQKGFLFTPDPGDYQTTQIRHNYVLELAGRTKDEVFSAFHPKWRYNIRVAQRRGVVCRICGEEALPAFYRLLEITGKRDGFTIRSYEYYQQMLNALGSYCRLYMCYLGEEALSGAITVQFAGKTSYVYGASSNTNRNLMPNYLMQWTMIQWAIEGNCRMYDFMGIPYFYDEAHPNYGVYRFKKGFNGRVLSYAGEFDFALSPIAGRALRWYLAQRRVQPAPVSPRTKPPQALEITQSALPQQVPFRAP